MKIALLIAFFIINTLFCFLFRNITQTELAQLKLYFQGEWSFFPKTEIEKLKSTALRNDIIFLNEFLNVKKIKDDKSLEYQNLIDSNGGELSSLLSVSEMKDAITGLELLLFGNLSKKQNEALVLFYKPYPNCYQLAQKLEKMSDDEKETYAKDFPNFCNETNLERVTIKTSREFN